MSLSVFIAVTHLLGAGHLTRAAGLGRAFAAAGHRVTLASGGMPAALISRQGIAFVQLPPVRAGSESFATLVDAAGVPVDEAYRARRQAALLSAFADARPDILVTELYPLGRRVLAAEFGALLAAAAALRPRPLIACSLRDILVAPVKPGRLEEAHRILRERYDVALIHGDPALVTLDASWPLAPDLVARCVYTGYVDHDPSPVPSPMAAQANEAEGDEAEGVVLVSGGSSAAALPLYRAALMAAAERPSRRWRLLVGGGIDAATFASLQSSAPANMDVERARPDFRDLLRRAGVFVGLAGYNTVLDLLATRVRAVLVPFERGRETEQRLRAERLAAIGLATLLPEAHLTPASLLQAVDHALNAPGPPPHAVDRHGATATVEILEKAMRERHPSDIQRWHGVDMPSAPALLRSRLPSGLECAVRRTLDDIADRGRTLPLWWRDDDSVAHTPALDRLLALARRFDLPLAIAAVPERVEPSLPARLAESPWVTVLVHGAHHANHAPPSQKRAEFGAHRPLATMGEELARSLARIDRLFGQQAQPVLVPPWNRIGPDLVMSLPALGYAGLSTFGESSLAPPDLTIVNTDLDPIDWRRGGLADDAALGAMWRRATRGTLGRPLGLLSHHLVMGDVHWGFMEDLLTLICRHPSSRACDLATLWSSASTRASGTSTVRDPSP